MKNFRIKNGIKYFLYTLLVAVIFVSCSKNKEGVIVKDKKGRYYQLTGEKVLGAERYRLIEIDTTKFKVVGFNGKK